MAKSGTPWSPTSSSSATRAVVSLDVNALDPPVARLVHREFTGSILDTNLLERILSEFEVDLIFHLAALLSTRSEFTPMAAHHVNVEGTLNLLEFAAQRNRLARPPCRVRVPLVHRRLRPARPARPGARPGASARTTGTSRITMYGCNKLYCEHLGRYYSKHYKQLLEARAPRVDFRCVRFPGLISAVTVPSGGTSDYASEMIHAAARGEPYACFVRPDSRIPFMAMPDAIEALLKLSVAQPDRLSCVGVQRARLQSVGRRDSRVGAPRVSRRQNHL